MDVAEVFNDSYLRCTASSDFLDFFYEVLMSSSPEVKDKFKNTDMKIQKSMLKTSLVYHAGWKR